MTAATTSEYTPPESDQPPFILLKRPFLLIATFLIPGIVLGHYFHPSSLTVWLLLPFFVSFLLALLLIATHSTFSTPMSMLVVLCVGFLLGAKTNVLPSHHVHFRLKPDKSYRLQGVIVDEPVPVRSGSWRRDRGTEQHSRYRFVVKGTRARERHSNKTEWKAVTGKILVYASGDEAGQLQYGNRVKLTGKAFLSQGRRNPGGFDYRKYLAQNGIYVCMQADAIGSVEPGHGSPILRLSHSLKRKFRRSFLAGDLNKQQRSFLHAIILGERREVGREFTEALRRTNTMHILAISGLHVAALVVGVYFLSRWLFVREWIALILALAALWVYAPVTGMRVPIVRASIMCTAFLIAPLLGRRTDSINSLAVAAAVILCINPGDLFTAGFQLSFMVVLSILLLSDKIFHGFVSLLRLRPDPGFLVMSSFRRRIYRVLEYPLRLFSVSLAAFAAFAPLGLLYFNHISLLGPLCNLATILLVTLIVPLGFLAGVVGLAIPAVAGFINGLNGQLISTLQWIVTRFASMRFASFNVSPPSLIFVFAFYSFVLLVGFARSTRRVLVPAGLIALLASALFLGGELARRHPDSIEITFLDVGQGDCAFVEFPDGRKILVDGGSVTRSEVGRYVIVPFLRWSGVNKLEAVVISHYDSDHINGLVDVLDDIRVRNIIVRAGPHPPETSAVRDLMQAIKEVAIARQTVRAGERLSTSPGVTALIFNPPVTPDLSRFSENDLSVVLKLGFRGASALLCGDIEKRAERLIIRSSASPRSHVLKVPHHGSNSSSSEEFVRPISPRIAIISCGRGNIYGHPSPRVLDRYGQLGVRVFRTDRDGGIVVRIYQDKLTVATSL